MTHDLSDALTFVQLLLLPPIVRLPPESRDSETKRSSVLAQCPKGGCSQDAPYRSTATGSREEEGTLWHVMVSVGHQLPASVFMLTHSVTSCVAAAQDSDSPRLLTHLNVTQVAVYTRDRSQQQGEQLHFLPLHLPTL